MSGQIKLTILIIRLRWQPAEIPWSYLFPSNRISFTPNKIFKNTRVCCSRYFFCNAYLTIWSAGIFSKHCKTICQVPTWREPLFFILFYNYIYKIFLSLVTIIKWIYRFSFKCEFNFISWKFYKLKLGINLTENV